MKYLKSFGKVNVSQRRRCFNGVVDCTHTDIEKSNVHGDEYVNRKSKTTLNVQVTCNKREIFTTVNVN